MCQHAKQRITGEAFQNLTNSKFAAGNPARDLLFYNILDKSNLLYWDIDPNQLQSLFKHILIERPSIGSLPAGYTYFGQLLTHEIVPDTDIKRAENSLRGHPATPTLNLDSIYFSDTNLRDKPTLMENGRFITRQISENRYDLNRTSEGEAKIPDPRNDDNVIVAQLLVKIQEFHNAVFDRHSDGEIHDRYRFTKAFVTLIIQRIIVEDYLQKILHPSIYEAYFIKNKTAFTNNAPKKDFVIPFEYSHAAFRFGHSMVRHAYILNGSDEKDLDCILQSGHKIEEELSVDWSNFFRLGGKSPQSALKINLELASNFREDQKDNRVYNYQALPNITLHEQFEKQAKTYSAHFQTIAYGDLVASQKVPSARDIVRSLEYSNFHPAYRFFQDLCLPSYKDYMRLVDFGEKFKRNVIKGQNFDIYACPLWLFFLREAEVFPFSEKTRPIESKEMFMARQIKSGMQAQGLENEAEVEEPTVRTVARPPCDHTRLGPIASIIVAETLKESISRAEINIYQKWSDISELLGENLTYLYAQTLSEHRYLEFTYIFKFLEEMQDN